MKWGSGSWAVNKDFLRQVGKYGGWIVLPFVLIMCHRVITSRPSDVLSEEAREKRRRAEDVGKSISFDSTTIGLPAHIEPSVIADPVVRNSVQSKITQLYRDNGMTTLWAGDDGPTDLYFTLQALLERSLYYGLSPREYDLAELTTRMNQLYADDDPDFAEIAAVDIAVSQKYFLFTTHLRQGKVPNTGYQKNIWKRARPAPTTEDVAILLDNPSASVFAEGVHGLEPATLQYRLLKDAIAQYIARDEKYYDLPATIRINRKIKPGEHDATIPLIRKKLRAHQDQDYAQPLDSAGNVDSTYYDETLANGVREFQERHGLEPDGVIGSHTAKFLNRSLREVIALIAVNMERLRWQANRHEEDYIVVNIPEFKLHLFENGKEKFDMRVIVGTPENATPVFSDVLEHIVFSPTWTVPPSIIREEFIPKLQEDPTYYDDGNFVFYKDDETIDPLDEDWEKDDINPNELTIVQKPGSGNALGLVKFVMPNNLRIYLHDTPHQRLFRRSYRAFSHGCIRLDEPEKFAEYLLRDNPEWNMDKIRKSMHAEDPRRVFLKQHYPIHLEYFTVWMDKGGKLNFREDIYGHDLHQMRQLFRSS